jgi:LPXTG-motif cell wall-anchored protein
MPFGVLPLTGFDVIGFGIPAAGLLVVGFISLRLAVFSRSRRRP